MRIIYNTLLKTELRLVDFQHFHWLVGHRLSALITHRIISLHKTVHVTQNWTMVI